ncbi:sulfite exporter TauE/SafE family protein [Elizabethkingia meningoseptica]|uniref:sulfite exporter TauE/SafE family protein n=1 Tax=Elizabethkingia meningoseptica TaxID=238 RepID=UPI003891EB4E
MFYLIVFVCSFLAFGISAICGGGAGLMLIPILNRFLPVVQVPAALSIGTASSSVSRIAVFYRDINWKVVRYFLPAALPAAWLGSWMLSYINPIWIELLMSVFLISNLPQVFKNKKKDYETEKGLKSWTLLIIGLFAGFISGITGAVGLLFNRFYLKFGMTNQQIVATRAANEVVLHIVKLIMYIYFGLFTLTVLKVGAVVALAAILSSVVMKKILPKISVKWFHQVGFSAMVISGVIMFVGFFTKAQKEENASLYTTLERKGFRSHLAWAEDNYTIEFKWSEGFEFEKVISYDDLPEDKKQYVDKLSVPYKHRVFEIVKSFGGTSYEVYFLDENGKLIKKLDF